MSSEKRLSESVLYIVAMILKLAFFALKNLASEKSFTCHILLEVFICKHNDSEELILDSKKV